jgi:beta-glucanase (GH16 family)
MCSAVWRRKHKICNSLIVLTQILGGNAYFTVTGAAVEQWGKWVYDDPFYLLLNVAVGWSWSGDPDGIVSNARTKRTSNASGNSLVATSGRIASESFRKSTANTTGGPCVSDSRRTFTARETYRASGTTPSSGASAAQCPGTIASTGPEG